MPVRLHGVPECLPARRWAGENLQFATAVIVEPLDAPLAGCSVIFEDLGWFTHSPSVPSPQLLGIVSHVSTRSASLSKLSASAISRARLSGNRVCRASARNIPAWPRYSATLDLGATSSIVTHTPVDNSLAPIRYG